MATMEIKAVKRGSKTVEIFRVYASQGWKTKQLLAAAGYGIVKG